ncbi:hypothetical protein BDZ97DRAFT_2062263 [Flammula alnicola]|nr:hypothetical protein BDZ97DRAFT_2062263 [Flammula alnicola]
MSISFSTLSDSDALEAARVAAAAYHHAPVIDLDLNPDQGCFSLTFVAKYADNTESIIQLRDTPVSVEITHLAHTLLGDIVPIIVPLKATKTPYAYGQPKVPGERWDPLICSTVEDDTAVSIQLAKILARCNLHLDSGPVVDNYVIPSLDSAINLFAAADGPFKDLPTNLHIACLDRLKQIRTRANNIKVLDLILCHIDPNPFNPSFLGQMSEPTNSHRHDEVSDAARPIGVAFWNALVADIPDDHRNAVLDSMQIGYILFSIFTCPPDSEIFKDQYIVRREAELFIERLDWFEEIFRPLCVFSSAVISNIKDLSLLSKHHVLLHDGGTEEFSLACQAITHPKLSLQGLQKIGTLANIDLERSFRLRFCQLGKIVGQNESRAERGTAQELSELGVVR